MRVNARSTLTLLTVIIAAFNISTTVVFAFSGGILSQYLTQVGTSPNDNFLRDFPYDVYLSGSNIADLTSLERDRTLINQTGRDGDKFLQNLFLHYLSHNAPNLNDPNDVQRLIDLADSALAYRTVSGSHPDIYDTVGYLVFENLSDKLSKAISDRVLDKNSRETKYAARVLARRGYPIQIHETFLEKLIRHIRAHEWGYILKRMEEEMAQYRMALFVTLTFLIGFVAASWRIIRRCRRSMTKVKPASTHSASTMAFLLLILTGGGLVQPATAQILSERERLQDGDMTVRRLYYGIDEVGSTIWLARGSERIKARYLAYGQVYQRYSQLTEPITLVCAGAFTEKHVDETIGPEGLTVDDGVVINRRLNPDWEGLVIVYATGGIAVSDLRKADLTLDQKPRKFDLRDRDDLTFFLNWAVRIRATVFQTQLLASNDGLRLNVLRAHKEFRERRFLAIVRNRSGEVFHVIFDVPKPFYLGPLAKLVNDYLLSLQTTVFGILNLDTGDYDIQQVNTSSGQHLSYLDGPKPINLATNLLVYYYSK